LASGGSRIDIDMGMLPILKRLIRLPMFTILTVLTLGLGIGANTAIFSVIEGVLLKPLPYWQPDGLIAVNHSALGVNLPDAGIASFLYFTYRDDNTSFQDVGMWNTDTSTVTGTAEPEEVPALSVTQAILPLLGVQPQLGRLFTQHDDSRESQETIILTYGYWQARFGGEASVIGRKLIVDGKPFEIIGVLPASFRFLDLKPSIVVPLRRDRNRTYLGSFNYRGMARLKPGVTLDQATADVARLIPVSIKRFPPFPGFTSKMFDEARLAPKLQPLKDSVVGSVSTVLWVLMGTVGLVLLIACANVANLLLVRVEGRQHELAIRSALGASRGQIARELLLESLTLGLAGGIAGLALAFAALRVLIAMAPAHLPRIDQISIDGLVLLFTLAISILAGLLFGAIPVFKYAGPQLANALRSEGRGTSASRERHRARNTLVIVQVALTLVLLISAGLMIRTFQALRHVDPGFTRPEEVLTLRISIPSTAVKEPEAVVRMEQAIVDRISAISGVTSVGLSSIVPMSGGLNWRDPLYAEDHAYAEHKVPPLRVFRIISPGLLKTMGNRLIAGREFTWTDAYEKRTVAMVSENLARELWQEPGAAIGKRVRMNKQQPWREIVGVVSDEHVEGVDQKAPPVVFWPQMMEKFGGEETFVSRSLAYIIRSNRTGTHGLLQEISQAVWAVNPNLPLANVRTLQEVYDKSLARTSFTLVMLAIAGGMALLLGVAGIYGVIAYSVSQRTREIGIRIALGAQHSEVTGMFVRHGALLSTIGIACGLAAAYPLTRFMSSMLFDVSALDPLTYVAVAVGLVAAAILASYIPALRATAVDPIRALKAE
jgi:putative ABC transport system permease protein